MGSHKPMSSKVTSFIGGLFLQTFAISSAFALSFDPPLPQRDLALLGLIPLLALVLAYLLMKRRRNGDPTSAAPDMRWWRNP